MRLQPIKKINCPSAIVAKEVILFPDFEVFCFIRQPADLKWFYKWRYKTLLISQLACILLDFVVEFYSLHLSIILSLLFHSNTKILINTRDSLPVPIGQKLIMFKPVVRHRCILHRITQRVQHVQRAHQSLYKEIFSTTCVKRNHNIDNYGQSGVSKNIK